MNRASVSLRAARALSAAVLLCSAAGALELAKAVAAFQAGEWVKAAQFASEVPADSPDRAKALYLWGEVAWIANDYGRAVECFQALTALRPDARPAQLGMARAWIGAKELEKADALLAPLAAKDAKSAEVQHVVGMLRLAQQKPKEAVAALAIASEAEPKNAEIARSYCEALWAVGDDAKASRTAQTLASSLPKRAMGPFLQAIGQERAGKDDKAIELYEEAIQREDAFLDAHKNLAILCHTQNPMYSNPKLRKKMFEHYERYFALGGRDPELEQIYKTVKEVLESIEKSGGPK